MSSPEQRALRLAQLAGRQIALDVSDAKVLRVRTSIHVELPAAGVVARVETTGNDDIAQRHVQVARLLLEHGAPIAELVQPDRQPFLFEDGAVVLWRRIRFRNSPVTFEEIGRSVRNFHAAIPDPLLSNLPRIDPLERIRHSLMQESPWTGSSEAKRIESMVDHCDDEWSTAFDRDPLGLVIVHGDVHNDNALSADRGPVLIDLEDAGIGPASWDFAPTSVGVSRYGLPFSDFESFVEGYGSDPRTWRGFEIMCRVYELLVASWAMQCSQDSDRMATEARLRVAALLDNGNEAWSQL